MRVVSASDDKTLKVWHLDSGELIATSTCDAATRSCAWSDADSIVAGDDLGRIDFLSLILESGSSGCDAPKLPAPGSNHRTRDHLQKLLFPPERPAVNPHETACPRRVNGADDSRNIRLNNRPANR